MSTKHKRMHDELKSFIMEQVGKAELSEDDVMEALCAIWVSWQAGGLERPNAVVLARRLKVQHTVVRRLLAHLFEDGRYTTHGRSKSMLLVPRPDEFTRWETV